MAPQTDASQDATLISFVVDEIRMISTATFSRPLITGDTDDDDLDRPIYLQYAYGAIINASINLIADPGPNLWISSSQLSFDCSGMH